MSNLILKHVMKDKTEDVLHSSAYARAQNPASMGSASSQSFNDRMAIDRNRTVIKSYSNSQVMGNAQRGISSMSKPASAPSATPPMPIRKNPGISR